MLKFLAIFCFAALGIFAANQLDEKSQKKIAIITGIIFLALTVVMVVTELMR